MFYIYLIIVTPLILLGIRYVDRRWLRLTKGDVIFLNALVFLFFVFLGLAVT
jgi:hypothetical protein